MTVRWMTLEGEGVHVDSWISPHLQLFSTVPLRSLDRTAARSVGRSIVRSFVRPLDRGSCALVSIPRMGLMGSLCVGSAEKRAGSIRGTGGSWVLSYLWWGVLLVDRRDPLGRREGDPREGLRCSTLSSIFSFSSFARTSYPLGEPPDLWRVPASHPVCTPELTVPITILCSRTPSSSRSFPSLGAMNAW